MSTPEKRQNKVEAVNKARATRLARIDAKKKAEMDKLLDIRIEERKKLDLLKDEVPPTQEKAKKKTTPKKRSKKEVPMVESDSETDYSSSEDSEEEVIVYKASKPKKRITPSAVQRKSTRTIQLEKQLAEMNDRFKNLEESSKKNQKQDAMLDHCKMKILNF